MMRRVCWCLTFVLFCAAAGSLFAGGSGLNVFVVVNQDSTNSVELGNYYSERRQVPSQNLLRINWPGGNVQWTLAECQSTLLNPLLAAIASRGLTNQIDFVLLSMDIPYRVTSTSPSGVNSTTSVLYYGFKPDSSSPSWPSCTLPSVSSNSYAGSEAIFRSAEPLTASSNAFLTMMLTSSNLAQAKAVVDRALASDGSFPQQPVVLSKNPNDGARNIRFQTFDEASFNTRVHGGYHVLRTNVDETVAFSNLLGYENGFQRFWNPSSFVPGAMADDLTSYGGTLFENSGHTIALAFLNAGATASYGTVVEPCNWLQKFPSPLAYFYQSRGFSIAECYYQSLTNPYQGVLVGEPLAAPFALTPAAHWPNAAPQWTLAGATNLALQCSGPDTTHPVQQVDLFLDGTFWQTLTNIAPRANNTLSVSLRGRVMNYTVPSGATIKSVASGLAALLNSSANFTATKCHAYAHGDRVELQSTDLNTPGSQVTLSATSAAGSAPTLTTFLTPSGNAFLDTVASGVRGFRISGNPGSTSDYLQLVVTRTNGIPSTVNVTNTTGGTNLLPLVQQLVAALNGTLQGADGIHGEDVVDVSSGSTQAVEFNLYPNSPGWAAAQVQADLNASTRFSLTPGTASKLDQNLPQLEPRAHLYLTAGVTSLPLTFAFNTTSLPDGFHELTAVAYEGSHVFTQGRASQNIQIANSTLAATFTGPASTTAGLNSVLQFSLAANSPGIADIELFSTGGALTNLAGQSTVTFSVPAAYLGIGLHPFYALVTATNGKQYRTETKWIRVLGQESSFALAISAPPPTLSWPATIGRSYEVLATTNLAVPFQVAATFTASNSPAVWRDTNGAQGFYRVRTAN